jgi:hypothetical protein
MGYTVITSYKILYNILLSRFSPYVDEIIEDDQCGFDTTDQLLITFFQQMLEKNMGVQCNATSAIHRLQESL